jgi:hypothetical protein
MCIPTKSSFDVVALHRPISWNDIFDCGCQKMAIMREATSPAMFMLANTFLLKRALRTNLTLRKGDHHRMCREGEIWRVQPEFRKL